MIRSFADKRTEELFRRGTSRKVPEAIRDRALKQLDRLDAALRIEDLFFPPSNRLERLAGERRYSIRVNRQYRLTFAWTGQDAENVCLEDYH